SAALPKRNDAVIHAFEVMDRDFSQLGGRYCAGDARLRRRHGALVILLRYTADTARIALRRDRQRRFAALEKDVLCGKARVVARAKCDLCEHAICRPCAQAPLDRSFELSGLETARLPVVAFVGLHRCNERSIVERARKRVTE